MDVEDDIKTDVLFKRYFNKSSTSVKKNWFEEREAAESRYPVYPDLQLYTQAGLLPWDVPADLQTLTESSSDDQGFPLSTSFVGKTSSVIPILRRFIKVPLVSVPSPCGRAYQSPMCLTMQSATAFATGEMIFGLSSSAKAIVVEISGAYVYFKSCCGIRSCFQPGEVIKGKTSMTTGIVVQDNESCPYNRVMKHIIPFDFGNGGYAYRIFRADGSPVYFGEGNWLVDTYSGVLTFYGSCPGGISDALPPSISFYKYVGKIGLNTSHDVNGSVGIGTDYPKCSLDINTCDAVGLPKGTTDQRPDPARPGYLRFNTDQNSFEGYLGCQQWTDLTKGLGYGSDAVKIGVGGISREITIGNGCGSTGISLLAGSGDISLSTAANISLNANSDISLQTRSANSNITIGGGQDNFTLSLIASGSNSMINLIGVTNLSDASTIAVQEGGAYYFADQHHEGTWRAEQIPCPADSSTTSLAFQKLVSGTWLTRFRMD